MSLEEQRSLSEEQRIRREKQELRRKVPGGSVIKYLEDIVICLFQASSDRFALQQRQIALEGRRKNVGLYKRCDTHLSCEHASIEPQIAGDFDQLDVCGHLLAHRYLDDVSRDERSSRKGRLSTIAEDNDIVREHVLDGCHDTGRREVLPRIEDRLEGDDH